MAMENPIIIDRTTRPVAGLTPKGRAAAALIRVRESWDSLSPDQQAECSAILDRLSVALRRENVPAPGQSRPLPLVARLSA